MGRVFACSDFHGVIENYWQINNYLKEDDKVYFLGDAADYTTNGWDIIKDLLINPKWIWILGEHDKMIADRILDNYNPNHISRHEINGGMPTWLAIKSDCEKYNLDYILDIANKILSLPNKIEYVNKYNKVIYMSHSGFIGEDQQKLLWDRTHFIKEILNEDNINYVIHGHTPIPYLIHELDASNIFLLNKIEIEAYDTPKAYWYLNHTKCDLDCLTAKTNATVLLDLDTFEEIIFNKDNYKIVENNETL